ncbi:hypothetical protein [Candidatus Electrothrix sp.]|uniref:hypothetical protein n=1 Tax=Candidatus Electrothrix sp. TaxID=2170559 RepID=UPI0040564624
MQVFIVDYSQIDKKVFRLEAEFHVSNSLLDIECFTGDEIIELAQVRRICAQNTKKSPFWGLAPLSNICNYSSQIFGFLM